MNDRRSANDVSYRIARMLMVSGIVGAVLLVVVSIPAALMCVVIAVIGRIIMERGRPTSRWARGWTAFRPGSGDRRR